MSKLSTTTHTDSARQDLRTLGEWTLSLVDHLSEHFFVEGQPLPQAGPPTNCDHHELTRHLVHIHTLLFRFGPLGDPEHGRLARVPDVASVLARIKLLTDHLAHEFGLAKALAEVVDGQWKTVPTLPLNEWSAQLWKATDPRPMPEVTHQDMGALVWAGHRLLPPPAGGRTPGSDEPFGINLDLPERKARRGEASADFAGKEYPWKILKLLCQNYPNSTKPAALLDTIWGEGTGSSETLYVHMNAIRKLIKPLGLTVKCTPKVGYRLAELSNQQSKPPPKRDRRRTAQ